MRLFMLLLFALLAASAGCATIEGADGARAGIGDRAVHVAPIRDPEGLLTLEERIDLRARVVLGLLEIARKEGAFRPPRRREEAAARRRPFDVAAAPTSTALPLEVVVERFEEGSAASAFVIGLGAGRPGWAARLSLGRGADSLGERDFERTWSGYGDPARSPRGAREAMLADVAERAISFVGRRR